MSEIEEISKAVQEVAKFGDKSLATASKLGSFFAKVLQSPITEISGIIHDKLRFVRWKRLVEMSDEVNRILESKGVTTTRIVPPKIAIPIFEDSSLEDNSDIRKLWNNLLSNAMNPNFNDEIRYSFIDMLKSITPKEALLLSNLYDALSKDGYLANISVLSNYHVDKNQITSILDITLEEYSVSSHNLMRLQLIGPAVINGGIAVGGNQLSAYKGIDSIYLTPLGAKFIEACIK
jgi:hypothetical protein